jgi:HD superfamily phosphohydrolase YqeK
MSAADSTDASRVELTAVEWEAARGQLPDWAHATPTRRAHMVRVVALLESWAAQLGLGETETLRWAAVGWLHDALRDADPAELRRLVRAEERDLPGPILHGPAAAARLSGHVGHSTLQAIRYHTIGHPALDTMGRAVYLADFLEPGRDFLVDWRAELRDRMPGDLDGVLEEVVATRVRHLLELHKPIRPETAAFWSALVTRRSR